MRSYYSHLSATQADTEQLSTTRKPVFRSSAIFPVLHNAHYSTQVLFMGYWLLKRNINEIGLLCTLRSEIGNIVSRTYLAINSSKAYRIELNEFEAVQKQSEFYGSIELEVFSTRDLVFPYPAFVVNYYGNDFSTAVHTIGRIYNDIEDLNINQEYKVRESGFDIHGNEKYQPFIAFTNGTLSNDNPSIQYKITNDKGQSFEGQCSLPALSPFETRFVKLKDYLPLNQWLGNGIGSIQLGHNFEGFFPRFLVGNFENQNRMLSITHSYYDCSDLTDAQSYWTRQDERFNDSSVQIPLYILDEYFTRIAIYPIFSPSDFTISFVFYDKQGNAVAHLTDYLAVSSIENKYKIIDMGKIVAQNGFDSQIIKSANIVCNWNNKQQIPTRIKFGLNIGKLNANYSLPCNICFAPALGNPQILNKKSTFRWAPFINIGKSEMVITNGGTLKNYTLNANVKALFHREADKETIERSYELLANEIIKIKIYEDDILKSFLGNASGWVSLVADNPFVNGWYFDFHESGAVAADHLF